MKTLNDYLLMNYRMEIVEDKDEGGCFISGTSGMYYLWRNSRIRCCKRFRCQESMVGSCYGFLSIKLARFLAERHRTWHVLNNSNMHNPVP